MKINKINFFNYKIIILFCIIIFPNIVYAQKTYFDLSQNEINIDTNFTGQELILFGLTEPKQDIIVVVRGPEEDLTIRNKKRILGFWFNTNSVTFAKIPKVYFICSNYNIEYLLDEKERYDNEIGFNKIKLIPKNEKNLFVDLKDWNESLIRIQKQKNMYKHFKLESIDEKLFQTRLYFPANIPTGKYDVTTYRIKDKKIISLSNKLILINKTGIGSKIYFFAQENSILYGIATIIFAIIIGAGAAAIFRKL